MTSASALTSIRVAGPLVLAALAACGPTDRRHDSGLAGLALESVDPETVVPGSRLVVEGRSFVDSPWGDMRLKIAGVMTYAEEGSASVEASLPLVFDHFDRGHVEIDEEALIALGGGEGVLAGEAWIEAESSVDGRVHESARAPFELEIREELTPEVSSLPEGGVIFVNEPMEIEGEGFLLGGDEGETLALVEGCFQPAGAERCEPVEPVEIPVETKGRERRSGRMAFSPEIAGIEKGTFEGSITLVNRHARGGEVPGSLQPVRYELSEPAIFELSPGAASLGQYVFVEGGGFLGRGQGTTVLEFSGSFEPDEGEPLDLDLVLIPELIDGRKVRYVLSEDDSLGSRIDLRYETGTLEGTLEPVTSYEGSEVRGEALSLSLEIAPVRQVVELRFLPSYVESLRKFGLRAVDEALRERVVDVVERDFATINVEVRRDAVEDYALHSVVEISGPDPNGLGLLGYDNTPGKDIENERLYDRIGGVNALTQEDGYPGYGGVFIESMFALSRESDSALSEPAFDEIFDPFRPEREGKPVRAEDLREGIPRPSSGQGCPAPEGTRREQIACAIWVLGSLVGTTLSHEIGHSLGLAKPYGEGFHNSGSAENRLMDSGANRPFAERAELFDRGPAEFCDGAYEYLREILPTDEPTDVDGRPSCS